MNDISVVGMMCIVLGIVFSLTLIFYEYDLITLIITVGVFSLGFFLFGFEAWLFSSPQQSHDKGVIEN